MFSAREADSLPGVETVVSFPLCHTWEPRLRTVYSLAESERSLKLHSWPRCWSILYLVPSVSEFNPPE